MYPNWILIDMIAILENGKCELWYNNACIGLVLQDQLYLLSLSENVNVVSSLTKEKKANS